MKQMTTVLLICLAAGAAWADESAGVQLEPPLIIRDATIVPRAGERLEHASLLIMDGRIAAIGKDIVAPAGARAIDAAGKFVYPGFIDAYSRAGLGKARYDAADERRVEGAFPSISDSPQIVTVEGNRNGIFARRDALEFVDVESNADERARGRGLTAALLAPPEAMVGGTASLISLDTRPLRSRVLRQHAGMSASFEPAATRGVLLRGRYPRTPLGVAAHWRQFLSDAQWYAKLRDWAEKDPTRVIDAPIDPDLEAMQPVVNGQRVLFWEADRADEILRALNIAEEFGANLVIVGGREADEVVERLRETETPVVLTIARLPEVRVPVDDIGKLRAATRDRPALGDDWRKRAFAPTEAFELAETYRAERLRTATALEEAGIPWALSFRDLKKRDEPTKLLHEMIEAGVPREAATRALTTTAARICGVATGMGSLREGAIANVTVLDQELGEKDARVTDVVIAGRLYAHELDERHTGRDNDDEDADAEESNDAQAAAAAADAGRKEDAADIEPTPLDPILTHEPSWMIETDAERTPAFHTGGSVLLRNATVLTVTDGDKYESDVLIVDGKIRSIGKDLRPAQRTRELDLTGHVVMPGIFDPHAHIALDAVNEGTMSVTPEVRCQDVIRHDDPAIYWALTGGTTTIHTMHGSANTIGGQNIILKLKYGQSADALILAEQIPTVKFALGENVKRQGMTRGRWRPEDPRRFPGTRMGVETVLNRALYAGREYAAAREAAKQAGVDARPFRRDLRLEALADIIAGDIWVNCHCYRADEILRLLATCERFGIRVGGLHHCLEAYRILPEIARHGCGTATFADWWAYKIEAYDAVPHNAGELLKYGVNSTIKSDSSDLMRHMTLEAAKAAKYGGLTPNQALALITINPARLFGLHERLGSIEIGKDADLAIFNGHPLDTFSKCVVTLIEGEAYYTHPSFDVARFSGDATKRDWGAADAAPRPVKHFESVAGGHASGKMSTVNPRLRGPDRGRSSAELVAIAAERQPKAYIIRGGTVHPVSGPVIKDADVLIVDDEIRAVGSGLDIPDGAEEVDARGLHVWPGLINAATNVGLYEIGQVEVTVDSSESGEFQPDVRAVSAFNPQSAMVGITRAEGVLTVLSIPNRPTIAGQAGLLDLEGWTMDEMLIEPEVGLVVNLPVEPAEGVYEKVKPDRRRQDDDDEEEEDSPSSDALRRLDRFFRDAKLYADERAQRVAGAFKPHLAADPRFDAMMPYVLGQKPVMFNVNSYQAILEALLFAERHALKPIILGGAEAWKLADLLAERDVPVIYQGTMMLPRRVGGVATASDAWWGQYEALRSLEAAGVKWCLSYRDASLAKLLPLDAGMAIAHGLDPDAAVRAQTLGAAEILGVADRMGSLEPGKLATVIVTTDHVCQATNEVRFAFVRGAPTSLETKHTREIERFLARPTPDLPAAPELRGPTSQTNWRRGASSSD